MFFVYLFAAVAGCLLVLVSVLSGGHGDAGADGGDVVLDASTGDSVSASHDGSAHAHHGAGHDGPASSLGAALGWLLSVQLWTYLLAFGGLTGLLLRSVAQVAEPLAGGCALGVGLGTALVARAVLRRVMGSAHSGTTSHDRLVGSSAQVLIPAVAGGTGKIRLFSHGHMLDLLARASDGGALSEGATVSILDMREGIAEVLREDAPPPASDREQPAARTEPAAGTAPRPAPALISSQGKG